MHTGAQKNKAGEIVRVPYLFFAYFVCFVLQKTRLHKKKFSQKHQN